MQLDVLREFVHLSRTLNYHTTAKELHISQPTLSNHISALEKELSFPLITRTHGVGLTPAGAAFLEWAAGVVASYDEALQRCRTIAKEGQLSFSVEVPQLIDRQTALFIERIRQFKESHPGTNVRMVPQRDKFVLDEIKSGYCDCAIFIQQADVPEIGPEYPGVAIVPLCQEEAVAWLASSNPLAQKAELSLRDLADSVIPIHVNNNARAWEMALRDDFRAFGLKPTLSYRYAASAEEFVLTQLREDDVLLLPEGYLSSPLYQLRDDRIAKRLSPSLVITSYVAYRGDESKTALMEFVRFIEEMYRKLDGSGE